jgi:hypothetical protein
MYLTTYATLDALRNRFGLASTDTGDDARLLDKLRQAASQLDRYTGRSFAPLVATRKFDYQDRKTLIFRGFDLLSLTSITNGDGTTVIDPSAIIPLGGDVGPIWGVELNLTLAYFYYLTTKTRCIQVAGIWGWHDDYASAWKSSGDSIPGGGITSSATSFTVTSVSGADAWNLTPRFQVGQLLRVDSEYISVVGVNSGTNTLTVVRGVSGSTAATHTAGTAISVYVPPADIVEIALRWAGWLYKSEDAGDYGSMSGGAGSGGVFVPPVIPQDLRDKLDGLRAIPSVL